MTKNNFRLVFIALLAGALTLLGYKYFFETNQPTPIVQTDESGIRVFPTQYRETVPYQTPDLTRAAEETVNAVVHVKNTSIVDNQPRNLFEFFYGGGQPRARVGTGSGVIISPDGYIITNNHVIENATKLEITLNNNEIYEATVVGTDPTTDIALLKIDGDEPFLYIPFGDSDTIRLGEWVLAVGNPFNLNSTVTAGIVSAKARNLHNFDKSPSSFIQTDAAVNRGNSGGALVNANGDLIGINTAITSETGSYVGYAFAVPSNIAKKVIEDILEYGNVQRVLLGISGSELNSKIAKELGVSSTQGVYVGGVEAESGAAKAGVEIGDVIQKIDNIQISKFSDLTGYLNSKRPNDKVKLHVLRGDENIQMKVTLLKVEKHAIPELGIEVKEAPKELLKEQGLKNGVLISGVLAPELRSYQLESAIITKINDKEVNSVADVKSILQNRSPRESLAIQFKTQSGETHTFIFR